MAKRHFKAGATSQTIDVFIRDSSSSTGAGLSGLVFNTSNLKGYYRKGATGSATAITLATQTVGGAWSSGGFVEIDATNMKGVYRFDVPDTILAASPWATMYFYGATNMAPCVAEVEIVAFDPFDTVRLGLTALPNAAAEAAGGLYTRGSGAGQINQDGNGRVDTNVVRFGGSAGTFSGGRPEVNTSHVAGTAQTGRDLGLNIDATVSSRLATAGYTAPDNATISAIAGYIDTEVAAIKTQTDKLTFTVANQVDANVLDWKSSAAPAMTGDAYAALTGVQAELGQGAPAANASVVNKIAYLYKAWRNRKTQTATTQSLFNDDAVTVDQKATVSDDGTTMVVGEVATGP